MEHPWWLYALLLASAVGAGVVNALAGGGTLLTFPTLLRIMDGVRANGTSTVALMPGSLASVWAYRRELGKVGRWPYWLVLPSIVGGYSGARLVTHIPKELFEQFIPWLIASATLLFLLQPAVAKFTRHEPLPGEVTREPRSAWHFAGLIAFQFLIAVYGGFFGAGIGILMLAALGLMGVSDIHEQNAVKTLQATVINVASIVAFVQAGAVVWAVALPMVAAAVLGGYLGAHYGRRLSTKLVRGIVVAIGVTLAAQYFYRQWATPSPAAAEPLQGER